MQRFHLLWPLLLFLFALLVRFLLAAVTQFDGLYGQDAFAYFNYALALLETAGTGRPLPPFEWPIGYPALVALFMALIGPQASAAQLVSLLTGAAVAPLVYLIVLECHSYSVLGSAYGQTSTHYPILNTPQVTVGAVVAGLLTAVAAQLTLYSLAAMSDAAGLFWATLSAWLLLRTFSHWQTSNYLPQRRKGRQASNPFFLFPSAFFLCTLTLALAIMTRWVYGLLLIPWGAAALLAARQARLSRWRIAAAAATALLIGVSLIGSQFINDIGGELSHIVDLRVVRWHPAHAWQSVVQNADGFFDYGRPTALYYLRPTFHPAYIFPLFTPFMLLGGLALRKLPRYQAALLLGWPLLVYLFLAGMAWQNWRFPLALFAALPVLVGLGLDWAWERLAGRRRMLLLVYCLIALASSGLWAVRDVGNFTAWANQNRQIALEIGHQLPPQATLLAFGLTATVDHYTDLDTQELFSLTARDLQEITRQEDPLFLLLDPDNVQKQWAGRSPGENYAWLQSHTRLTPIARYDDFVLYRVAP